MAKTPAAPGSINGSIAALVATRDSVVAAAPATDSRLILLDDIVPSPFQPPRRRAPPEETLLPLADNIEKHGQLQNIIVRQVGAKWELLGGERRWRAHMLLRARALLDRRAKWETIRADVRNVPDAEAADIVASENFQREDIHPLDEAFTYEQLMVIHNFQQAKQLADHIDGPLRTIQRLLQLHRAPQFLKDAMTKGILVEGAGEDAGRAHRTLDKEQALVFLRFHSELMKASAAEEPPRDVVLAQAEADSARRGLEAATDLTSKEGARKRLEAAGAAENRAMERHQKEQARRADARTKGAIDRALRENWSLRRVEAFHRGVSGEKAGPAPAKPEKSGPTAVSATLFTDDGLTLVVHRPALQSAPKELRERLDLLLCDLRATLVSVGLGDEASKSGSSPTSALTPGDPETGSENDPEPDPAVGEIRGSGAGSLSAVDRAQPEAAKS
jgi:ParB/RepB/Spo0J family partition protein